MVGLLDLPSGTALISLTWVGSGECPCTRTWQLHLWHPLSLSRHPQDSKKVCTMGLRSLLLCKDWASQVGATRIWVVGTRRLFNSYAIWRRVLYPGNMASLGHLGEIFSTGTLTLVPSLLSLELHNPVSPYTIPVCSEPPSLCSYSGWVSMNKILYVSPLRGCLGF